MLIQFVLATAAFQLHPTEAAGNPLLRLAAAPTAPTGKPAGAPPAPPGAAAAPAAEGAPVVERHSAPIGLAGGRLTGPGADRLMKAAADAQFVILIESHNDHVTPAVTSALFGALHERGGFNYLAIEQDPFGMRAASASARRGQLSRIAEHARSYPYSYTFSTDEELQLLAEAGRISTGGWDPVWGVDQVFGATLLLEELRALTTPGPARDAVGHLLAAARAAEARKNADGVRDQAESHFMSSAPAQTVGKLVEIEKLMNPAPRSRAAELIEGLRTSAEIYSYYDPQPAVDAAGTPLSLLNNTVREHQMKRYFMREYRMAEAADGEKPRVVVKAGYFHAVRGLNRNGAFTFGNFLHEFAASNGSTALSVQVLALREWWPTYESISPEYRVLLPSRRIDQGSLVDLRPLRAHFHAGQAFGLTGADLRNFRELIFGVDFALFIPSKPGERTLTTMRSVTGRR